MPGFTLRQLELFAALPKYRTLSAAAAELHISESALSHAVSELERAVGEQLCVRRKARGLQLTPAGQFFAERARALVHDADELISQLAAERGELIGPVKIGCYTGFASTVLPPVLDGFARAHPKVEIGISIGTDDELLPALSAGLLDVAIVYDMFLPEGLDRRAIYDTEVLAVLPADHALAEEESVSLADLESEPFIMLDTAPSAANTRRMFADRGLEPNLRVAVPTLELVRVLVGRGLGYSLLMWRPNYSMTTLEGRQVVMRPLRPQLGATSVVAVWPEHMVLSTEPSQPSTTWPPRCSLPGRPLGEGGPRSPPDPGSAGQLIENQLTADDRHQTPGLGQQVRIDGEDVLRQDGEVGEEARYDPALLVLGALRARGPGRVRRDDGLDVDLLLGAGGIGHGRKDPDERVEWTVRADPDRDRGVEQGTKRRVLVIHAEAGLVHIGQQKVHRILHDHRTMIAQGADVVESSAVGVFDPQTTLPPVRPGGVPLERLDHRVYRGGTDGVKEELVPCPDALVEHHRHLRRREVQCPSGVPIQIGRPVGGGELDGGAVQDPLASRPAHP